MGDPPESTGADRSPPAVEHLPDLPFATGGSALSALRTEVTEFVAERIEGADAERVVVPMGGNVESTTTAVLAAEAIGSDRVLGLSLPAGEADADVAAVAAELGVELAEADLSVLLDVFEDAVAPGLSTDPDREAVDNVLSRFRMTAAYFAAETRDGVVCGTATRTDRLLGRVTKHGDDAADLLPLGNCWTTEVCALARLIGVPSRVLEKGPATGDPADRTDEPETPHGFVDVVLHLLIDADLGIDGTASELGVDRTAVERIARIHLDSRHKRRLPPTPADDPSRDRHFHELELDPCGDDSGGDGER